MYIRVYSPNGEPFDVPRLTADKLILQEGWTQQPFTSEEPVETDQPSFNFELHFDEEEEDDEE